MQTITSRFIFSRIYTQSREYTYLNLTNCSSSFCCWQSVACKLISTFAAGQTQTRYTFLHPPRSPPSSSPRVCAIGLIRGPVLCTSRHLKYITHSPGHKLLLNRTDERTCRPNIRHRSRLSRMHPVRQRASLARTHY